MSTQVVTGYNRSIKNWDLVLFQWKTNTGGAQRGLGTMKRFFQPVEKDGSAKRPNLSSPKSEETSMEDKPKREPTKFLTWNANSFLLRIKNNWPEFTKFITTFDPDVIAIQV